MPQYRKPVPKSQKEISNDQITPYVDPETGETLGNPNIPSDYRQFTPTEQNGVSTNRSEKLSFTGDTVKPFTIGLQDIDESIMYYFENVIRPYVFQNGSKIPVPIIYGTPERWKSTQKDGYYKDLNGAIMSPLIMFKRDTVDKNRSITNKLDANSPHLYTSFQKAYNPKNSYSNFNVLTNRIPVKQFVANVVPDYVTLTYSCVIQTYYVEQLNKIIEAINYASDSYWGDPERFKFKASIDSFSTIVEIGDTENRVVKGAFSIKLYGYMVPDTIQKDVTAVKKYNSTSKITIGLETVDSLVSPSIQPKPFSPIFIDGQTPVIGGGTSIDPAVIIYLNTNIQKLGTYVNPTTVTFASGWLAAPSGLPATSVNNFSIFCNGALIEQAAISSFTESGGVTTLVINSSQLGYSFDSMDEVVAIGKFSS